MDIGERIRKCRENLDMTQEELALKLGYKSRSSVNKVENSRELSINKVRDYAKALGVSPAYLMGWTEHKPDNAELVADISGNPQLLSCIEKLTNLPKDDQQLVYGYVDALYSKNKAGD